MKVNGAAHAVSFCEAVGISNDCKKFIPVDGKSYDNPLQCPNCTFVNADGSFSCEMCDVRLLRDSKDKECPKCSFDNAKEVIVCQVCDFAFDCLELEKETDDFNVDEYFKENVALYVQCPNVNCQYHIEVRNPGFIENVLCPSCKMGFCSQCKGLFHGIPPQSFLESGRLLSQFEERLTCEGSAKLIQKWNEYKNGSNDHNLAYSDCKQKHHVNVSEFYEDWTLLKRLPTHEYRLKCSLCTSDIIGPRFCCIHCVQGYNLCFGCKQNDEGPLFHNPEHSFQIFLADEHPAMYEEPRRCYICFIDDEAEEEDPENPMIKLDHCSHYGHILCLQGQIQAGHVGKHINFKYLNCGQCSRPLSHPALNDAINAILPFRRHVEDIVLAKCREDDAIEELEEKIARDERAVIQECMDVMVVYTCSACSEPFVGGRVDCAEDFALDITSVRCQECNFKLQAQIESSNEAKSNKWRGKCVSHGFKSAVYKCGSCCSVATFGKLKLAYLSHLLLGLISFHFLVRLSLEPLL